MSGAPAAQPVFYLWRSDVLKQYRPGHIIAVGSTVEDARERVRAGFEAWLKENREFWFDHEGKPFDECFEEDLKAALSNSIRISRSSPK